VIFSSISGTLFRNRNETTISDHFLTAPFAIQMITLFAYNGLGIETLTYFFLLPFLTL